MPFKMNKNLKLILQKGFTHNKLQTEINQNISLVITQMEAQDIRYIENPFEKIFQIIMPDKQKLYTLLIRLIEDFFNKVKVPTLSNYCSDPKYTQNDISAFAGANGYLYMMIRLARYFGKEKMESFVEFSNSSHIKSDGDLNKFMDPKFYIEKAIEQYKLIEKETQKMDRTLQNLSFYISEVCTWVCGMHIGYDTRNHALFRQNQKRILQIFDLIKKPQIHIQWQLLYGVPGFLYAILQLQHEYDKVEDEQFKTNFYRISMQLTEMIIARGILQYGGTRQRKFILQPNLLPEDFRLVYKFQGYQYLGAAHGLAGNLNVLLMSIKMNEFSQKDMNRFELVINASVVFLLKHFVNGNFSAVNKQKDIKLVHFCHDAPGIVVTLARFMEIFPQKGIALKIPQVVQQSLEHIWKYGVLKKGFSLCHGISGNAYPFLSRSIARILPEKVDQYRKKALLFGLLREQEGVMKQISTYDFKDRLVVGKSDNPYSLMLGVAGDICFTIDAFEGVNRFPGFNLQF